MGKQTLSSETQIHTEILIIYIFNLKMFDSCTRQTKIITAIVIGVTILCIVGEFIYFIFSPCRNQKDLYEEDLTSLCSSVFLILLPLLIFLPALIGFIILAIRIYLDRRELKKHQQEADALNSKTIVN